MKVELATNALGDEYPVGLTISSYNPDTRQWDDPYDGFYLTALTVALDEACKRQEELLALHGPIYKPSSLHYVVAALTDDIYKPPVAEVNQGNTEILDRVAKWQELTDTYISAAEAASQTGARFVDEAEVVYGGIMYGIGRLPEFLAEKAPSVDELLANITYVRQG